MLNYTHRVIGIATGCDERWPQHSIGGGWCQNQHDRGVVGGRRRWRACSQRSGAEVVCSAGLCHATDRSVQPCTHATAISKPVLRLSAFFIVQCEIEARLEKAITQLHRKSTIGDCTRCTCVYMGRSVAHGGVGLFKIGPLTTNY